jgi:pyrroline-5-carboxylate reductase
MGKIGFIGTGHIATAMIKALLNSKDYSSESIYVYDINQEKLQQFQKEYRVIVTTDNRDLVSQVDMVILSVRPDVLQSVVEEVKGVVKDQIIISPAAGIESKELLAWFSKDVKLCRIMPNVGAALSVSMTAYFELNINKSDHSMITAFLSAMGHFVRIKEEDFHIFIAMAGSSPAFFAYFIQIMVDYGIKEGFNKDEATTMAAQAMYATSLLLLDNPALIDTFVETVASKGGTTEAGVNVLKNDGFDDIVKQALLATIKRSKSINE